MRQRSNSLSAGVPNILEGPSGNNTGPVPANDLRNLPMGLVCHSYQKNGQLNPKLNPSASSFETSPFNSGSHFKKVSAPT